MSKKYLGIYDLKESDTFRPTLENRIHLNAKDGKTLTCRSDSFCIIESGGEDGRFNYKKNNTS